MSTASTATALAEMDQTMGDDAEIVNWICVLVTTWGSGTPLGPTYFGEQDMIELSIGLGQEYLEGVPQLLDTETVLAFPVSSNMIAIFHCFAAAMIRHGKPVKFCLWPPKTMQVRHYIATRGSHSSGTQAPAQGEEVESWPLPSEPHLDNGPQLELTWDIWDLDIDELWEVLKALHMEVGRSEGAAPPQGSPGGSLRVPWGGGMAKVDVGEVTFWGGRSRDQASPHSSPQVPLRPMQMLATSSACLQPGWEWAPQELIPLVVMPLLGRLKYLSSSGTTISSASGTNTQRKWSRRVSSGYWRGQQWIWPGTWGPLLALTISQWKLSVIFGMVASFNVLMQNFYKVTQGIMRRSLLCYEVWRDPKSNPTSVPQNDDRPGGATAPQWLPLPWGLQTYPLLHLVPLYSTLPLVPPTHNWWLPPTGQKVEMKRPGEKWGLGTWWQLTWGGNGTAESTDCQINGCPDPDKTGQCSL